MGRTNQLAVTYQNLATMLKAGLPLFRVFDAVTEHMRGSMAKTFSRISAALRQGQTVSEAMGAHPRVFKRFDRTLIKAADQTGNLDLCFDLLAQWYEFVRKLQRIILTGMMLPLLVLNVAGFVFPLPALVLGEFSLTQYLLEVASILGSFYMPILVVVALIVLGPRIPVLRTILDTLVLMIPVLGKGVRELCIARFSRAFSMLYKAGVPISECFDYAPSVAGNSIVTRFFSGGARAIEAGEMPSQGFSARVPREYRELWLVGEETGQLEQSADKIAEIAGDRAELLIGEFARWLPRLLYFMIMLRMVGMVLSMARGIADKITTF